MDRLQVAAMRSMGEQLVKVYRSMCTVRTVEERVHREFATGQILGFVHPYAGTHRGRGHSI